MSFTALLKGFSGTLSSYESRNYDVAVYYYSVCSLSTFDQAAQYQISLKSSDQRGVWLKLDILIHRKENERSYFDIAKISHKL